jgi:hypothetical protein
MRSPIGTGLVVLALATAAVLVLVLLQTIGLRSDLNAAREEVVALKAEVDGLERGVPISELSMRLAELENDIQEWVVAFSSDVPAGGDPTSPAGGAVTNAELLDRIEDVLARIDDLDGRIDEICDGVPVC